MFSLLLRGRSLNLSANDAKAGKRRLVAWLAGTALVAVVLTYLPGAAGEYLVSSAQEPVKADIIFPLGGGAGHRIERSLDRAAGGREYWSSQTHRIFAAYPSSAIYALINAEVSR